jgi:hypothetical protein
VIELIVVVVPFTIKSPLTVKELEATTGALRVTACVNVLLPL